jgi:hypothetical protein
MLDGFDAEGALFQRITPSSLPEEQFSVIFRNFRRSFSLGRMIITCHLDVEYIQNPIPKESSFRDEQVEPIALFISVHPDAMYLV